ncbi:MAG: ABC transporter ATP-binding protein [Flavobacteriia bacterium]|nr:ABC transporter ATP-binding protein [Flavobacteriia bacterium]
MLQQSKVDFKVFKRLIKYVKPYRKFLFLSFLFTLFLSVLSPARPFLIGKVVHDFIVESQNHSMLLQWTLLILIILILEGFFQFLLSYFSSLLAQSVIKDIRIKLFKHISTFRMKYFDKTPIGNLVTRVVSDIEAIADVFSSGLIDVLGDLLMLIVIIFWMFFINWKLSLMTLIPIPLLILATRIFAKAMRKSFQQESTQVNRLNTFVQERLTGMSLVQLFNREKKEAEKFNDINKAHRQAHVNAVWAFSIFFPVVDILSSLSVAFLLVWGSFQFLGNHLPDPKAIYEEIFQFTLWINMLFRPVRMLADKFNILQRGIVRADRVFEVLDRKENIQQEGHINDLDFNQNITFKNIFFAYKGEEFVLKNINLEIEAGKTYAFVGATGSGKTTIVNLLSRFYEYQKGDIFIGNTNLKDIELNYLRKNVSTVLQDVFLFSDSIYHNITLGSDEIPLSEVKKAAKAINADEFIEKCPNQYDYLVGERGGVLSVGQRQLISFIRAYLYNPHILILDEATSSVDNESEELIQDAIETLTKGRTSIIIAHRLSTIQNADKIVVLEKGEIQEIGTHQELMDLKGKYFKMVQIQYLKME